MHRFPMSQGFAELISALTASEMSPTVSTDLEREIAL